MAFNGSGVFNRVYNWVADAASGVKIRADRMDTEMDGFATGLSNCVTKDGQTTVTANLPMNGYKLTGTGDATARNQYLTLGQAADGKPSFCPTVGGTGNAITLTNTVPYTAYVTGMKLTFFATAANTGTTTVNVDGLGARNIRKRAGNNLISDDIQIGQPVTIVYDGTNFRLTSGQYSITSTDLATNAVTTAKITDANVTTAKIADANVTYAKIQNVSATDRLLGRSTSGAGVVEEITCTAAGRAILDDADATAQRTTLGVWDEVVNVVRSHIATVDSTTTVIPLDDTIPQITEGKEFTTATITPKSATNQILVRAVVQVSNNTNSTYCTVAIFRDSVANALNAATARIVTAGSDINTIVIEFLDSPATTSAVTYRLRFGPSSGTAYVNQGSSGRLFGGVSTSGLTLVELRN